MVILVDEFWSFLENQPLPCVKVAYPLNTFWSGGQCAISSSVFSGANQPLPCVKVAYPLNIGLFGGQYAISSSPDILVDEFWSFLEQINPYLALKLLIR